MRTARLFLLVPFLFAPACLCGFGPTATPTPGAGAASRPGDTGRPADDPEVFSIVVEYRGLLQATGFPAAYYWEEFDLSGLGGDHAQVAATLGHDGFIIPAADGALSWNVQDPEEPWTLATPFHHRQAPLCSDERGLFGFCDGGWSSHCTPGRNTRTRLSLEAVGTEELGPSFSSKAMCPGEIRSRLELTSDGTAPWPEMATHARGEALSVDWRDAGERDLVFARVLYAPLVDERYTVDTTPVFDDVPGDPDALLEKLAAVRVPITRREIPGDTFSEPGVYFVWAAFPAPTTADTETSVLAVGHATAVWVP